MTSHCSRRRSFGQASIEYLVVLAFGVIVLIKPFSDGSGAQAPALQQLATAVKDYHKHYTYAMAIAAIPDCDYQFAYDKSTDLDGILKLTGTAAIDFDRCIDWGDPKVPGLDVKLNVGLAIPASVKGAITTMVNDMIEDALGKFLKPADFLGDMLGFPKDKDGILDLILP